MNSMTDQPIELHCPNPRCKSDLHLKVSDVINKGKGRCSKCGSEITFSSSAVNALHSAVSDFEKSSAKLLSAMSKVTTNAQVNIKTKL